MKCGHGNEYMNSKPTQCKKCGQPIVLVAPAYAKVSSSRLDEGVRKYIETKESENYDPLFSNAPPLDMEPFTEEEINSIVVANANQTYNLKDIIKEEAPSKKRRKK